VASWLTLALLVILVPSGRVPAAEVPLVVAGFDDAETMKAWSFSNGAEFPGARGSLAWSAEAGRDRPGCLALGYDFSGGGNYVSATWNLPRPVAAAGLSLWLKKPAGHGVTIRATDATGQTHQKTTHYAYPDWQRLEVDLTRFTSHWGGADDGKVHPPIRSVGVLVENSTDPRQGTLLIDDVSLTARPAGRAGVLTSTYTVAEFTSETGRREYALDDRRSRSQLMGGVTLLGEPDAMRLVLDSDGSGHAVHAEFASHFQTFFNRIGALGPAGRQVIDVPLGDLKGWRHAGMENDGKVRYPLRLTRIWLEPKPDGPRTGTLRLHRLEADIHFAAKNAVQLRPDIREAGGDVAFLLDLQNIRAHAVKGRLVCEYRNLARRLDIKTVEVELPGGGATLRREFTFPRGDHHMVEAVFHWLDPELPIAPVSIGTSAPPPDPGSPRLEPESLMGCGLYLYRWNGNPAARENMARVASLAQRAGVKWTREEFQWSATEPRPGEFRFDFYDQVVEIAHAHGISVYGLLCYWAPWAKQNTPEGIDQYCNWVRRVVRRYKDRIHHWEIWNEPNIFFWSGPKELYATLLDRAYEAVKAEDPTAAVLGCSTSGIDVKFIEMVMARGGRFDALTIHPYRGQMEELRYIDELRAARQLVGGREVWLTEIGFPSHLPTGWSERRQAALAARTYLASVASGAIRSVSWYDFRNDGPDPYENEQNFGLVRHDFRPKPAYRALATVCRTLGGMGVKEQIDVGPGAYAFRFSDGRRDVIAACAPEDGRLLAFETDADVALADGFDQPIRPLRDQARHTLTLDSGFPVYAAGPSGFAFKPVEPRYGLRVSSSSVRAGDRLEVTIWATANVQEWEVPYGWPAPEGSSLKTEPGAATWLLNVPADAAAGRYDAQAILKTDPPLRLPVSIRVTPAVIRF